MNYIVLIVAYVISADVDVMQVKSDFRDFRKISVTR